MKRKILFILVLALCMSMALPAFAAALTATPTAPKVLVNGKDVSFDAYNIEGSNYFKLRDLAYILNGTEKQFDVGWDGTKNAISLTSGKAYTSAGGEMTGKGAGAKTPTPTRSKIYLDGKEVTFTAYNIDGNNYFKLRDIGVAFDFGVDWDGDKNTIVIDTSKGYKLEQQTTPPPPPGLPSTTTPPSEEIAPNTSIDVNNLPPLPERADGWARAKKDVIVGDFKTNERVEIQVKEGEIVPYRYTISTPSLLYIWNENAKHWEYYPEEADWEILN